ncbi:AraC family transcriptional regulator [Paenibacillus koleovorans]|uniref:AraC family transcriptional regulator n=1 Tax=Paenibacillus koleovorans TaxID=121608 RepID=UPI0035A23C6C
MNPYSIAKLFPPQVQGSDGTSYNVTRIAMEAGFTSVHQFNTLFAAKYGDTPRAWRKLHAQQ